MPPCYQRKACVKRVPAVPEHRSPIYPTRAGRSLRLSAVLFEGQGGNAVAEQPAWSDPREHGGPGRRG